MRTQASRRLYVGLALTMLLGALCLFVHGAAQAHGKTTVGDYDVVIGFHNEPAVVGMLNSLDLFVTKTDTGDPVNGLEQTLQAEVTFGSQTKQVDLYPQEDLDGAYGADIIPTRAGDYTWHIWGDIEGTPADVSMTSSPTTFDTVAEPSELSFPDAEPSLENLSAQAGAARQSALIALVVGVVGVLIGVVGVIMAITARRQSGTSS
jgi:hypothetical protein